MIVNVIIDGQVFQVEVEDINARPILAKVGGQTFEVIPENQQAQAGSSPVSASAPVTSSVPSGLAGKVLHSPLPGTVISVFAQAGDTVESGQVLLIIEAMKMKNSIRSTRAGTLEKVLVSAGQSVAHKQALLEFTE